MGVFRLFLAYIVVAYHLRVAAEPWGIPLGLAAVAAFCLLSGFVMTMLIQQHYSSLSSVGLFYMDRAARLYPQFTFYVVGTALLVKGGIVSHDLISQCGSLAPVLGNLTILPLGISNLRFLIEGCLPLPQTWSLALEATFYLAIPFLLISNFRLVPLFLSAGVFVLAYAGMIGATYGFITLPGSLWIFLCGSLLATWRPIDKFAIAVVALLSVAGLILTFKYPSLDRDFTRSVLLGTLTALPCVYFLKGAKFGSYDRLAGNISYGVFLSHFVYIWLWQLWGTPASFGAAAAVMVASTVSAAVTFYLVEQPALKWRRRLRKHSNFGQPSVAVVQPPLYRQADL
jgi:peptidoglycan/LPS O-acetylase OafA/YrhL